MSRTYPQKKEISLPKPPQFAPMKLQATRKPRSQTVGGDSLTTSLDFGLGERPKIEEEPASALTQSVEVSSVPKDAKTGQGKVVSKMKTVPILPGVAQKSEWLAMGGWEGGREGGRGA